MLFVYFHFKGMPKINTAENKKSNIRRSCRNLCLIFCNQKIAENVFSYNATVRPILLVKNMKSHSVLLLFIFSMPSWIYECNQLTFKYEKIAK